MSDLDTPALELGRLASPRRSLMSQLNEGRRTFLMVFVLVAAAGGGIFTLLPPSYRATATVIVAVQEAGTSESSAAWVEKLGDPADIESQLLLVRSPRLLRQLVADPVVMAALRTDCETAARQAGIQALLRRIWPPKSCDEMLKDNSQAVSWIEAHLVVGAMGRSRVIAVTYQSPAPEVAQTMANALVRIYLDDGRQQQLETRAGAVDWLHQQLAQLREELHQDDVNLEIYRRDHGLVRGQMAPINTESLTATAILLAKAQASEAEAKARKNEVSSETNAEVLESKTISDLKSQLSAVSGQLAARSASVALNSPVLTPLREQKAEIQSQIDHETRRIVASAEQSYVAATSEVSSIAKQFEEAKASVSAATAAEAAISNMVRESEIKRELYVDLVKKADMMETERRIVTGNVRLVSFAELPKTPWFPKAGPFAAAGLVLAAGLAALVTLLRAAGNQTVRAAEPMTWLAGARVVGGLPHNRQRRLGTMGQARQPAIMREGARVLYAQIRLALPGRTPKTLMVTSFGPGEGKTTTVFTLGEFVASTGQRVLAIECDLWNPGFQVHVPPAEKPGLNAYLQGKATFAEIVASTGVKGLDLIRASEPDLASTELLATSRMTELLQKASAEYDLVLLDAPPSGLLTDAHLLARQVDGVLYCARNGKTRVANLTAGVRAIQDIGGTVAGIAITMCREGNLVLYRSAASKKQQPRLAYRPS